MADVDQNISSQPESHNGFASPQQVDELSNHSSEKPSVTDHRPKTEQQLANLSEFIDEKPNLRPQQPPLPAKLRGYKPPPQHVVVISFGSFGIRYGFASDSTPKKLYPAIAFPRHSQALDKSDVKPLRIPSQIQRSKEDVADAAVSFDAVCDEIVGHLALSERRRGGGKPIPWKVEVESLESPNQWKDNTWLQDESAWDFDRGEIIIGQNVTKLASDEQRASKYDIIFPIWDGKVLFGCGASSSLIRKAWEVIIDYIIKDLETHCQDRKVKVKNDATASKYDADLLREHESFIREYSNCATTFVSLIFPETSQRRDVSELVDIAFRSKSLRCAAVFVHQSAVSCALGAGLSTCVVVDIGHSATVIACVEDGIVCGETRIHLRYGSYHVQKAFELLLQRNCPIFHQLLVTDYENQNSRAPLLLNEEAWIVTKACEQTVSFNVEENDALLVTQVKAPSGRTLRLKLGVGVRAVPAYGLIYPQLLRSAVECQPTEDNIIERDLFERNSEDDNFVSDIFSDLRRSFIATSAHPIAVFANDKEQPAEHNVNSETASLVDAIIWSIAKAIEVKRPDQQTRTPDHYRRYLNAILLAGGGASIEGIALALEGRIKKGFQDAGLNITDVTVIDGVKGKGDEELVAAAAVLKDVESDGGLLDDTDTASLPWKGGAVMVEADAVNDFWIYRDDWDVRNVRALREKAPFYW